MSLDLFWLGILGFLLAGYLVLGGYDIGVELLKPALARTEEEHRQVLNSFGPFFLGNEVWLVAFAGAFIGAFPHLEGPLLAGAYPFVVTALLGLVLGNASVQLRSRTQSARAVARWDVAIPVAGALSAAGLGALAGLVLRGLPAGGATAGLGDLLHPVVFGAAATAVALFAGHGAAFAAVRTHGEVRERARRLGGRLLAVAAGLVAATAVLTALWGAVVNGWAAAGLALLVAGSLLFGAGALRAGRDGHAFAASGVAAGLTVPAVGLGLYPYVLVERGGGGVTLQNAVTDDATLGLLTVGGLPFVAVVLAVQVYVWWTFGRREGPGYF